MKRCWLGTALLGLLLGCDGELAFEEPRPLSDAGLAGCAEDEDCELESLHCDGVSAQCVACLRDEHCEDPSRPRCDGALHRCVGCGSDLDCGEDETCLPMTRSCVTRCAEGPSEDVCPASAPTCDEVARICVQCASDEECREINDDGEYCERASGRCVQCTDDRQCPATRPRCDRVQHRCGECSTTVDCPPDRVCDPTSLRCT